MLPIISERDGNRIKIELTVALSGSMLEAEESILRAVNAVGNVATGEGLKRFDADGDPIVVGARDGTRRASCRRFIILITMFVPRTRSSCPGQRPAVFDTGAELLPSPSSLSDGSRFQCDREAVYISGRLEAEVSIDRRRCN